MKDMGYTCTFIRVATDCPATSGVVPGSKGDRKPIHILQYELLAANPYRFTHADLLYEVHVLHKSVPPAEQESRAGEIRAELLSKPHPCLRACLLPKKYGWGLHYDELGRIRPRPRRFRGIPTARSGRRRLPGGDSPPGPAGLIPAIVIES